MQCTDKIYIVLVLRMKLLSNGKHLIRKGDYTMAPKLQYTIDGQYYTESGYSREELRGLVRYLANLFPEVEIDIDWRSPISHPWIDLTENGIDGDLQVEIIQLRDNYLQQFTA